MPLQVKYFDSTLPGAPSLTGQAGTLVTLLDAVLVNGFNTKTVSGITRSGSTATATTSTAHGYAIGAVLPLVLAISGADQPEYNGEFVVTPLTTTTFSFTVTGTPATPATSSGGMSSKVAPLGWSKPFSGTNLAIYKQPVGSNGMYLRVDDNQTGALQRVARVVGYETMSDAMTGDGPFPTSAQLSGGGSWFKSKTQDATARPWMISGDAYLFYYFPRPSGSVYAKSIELFGDPLPYRPGDVFCTMLGLDTVTDPTTGEDVYQSSMSPANLNASPGTAYYPRSYSQLGSAVRAGLFSNFQNTASFSAVFSASNSISYPNPIDSGALPLPVFCTGAGQWLRGVMPGLYADPHQNNSFTTGDYLDNVAGLPGRRLVRVGLNNTAYNVVGGLWLDVTGPWR